MPKKEALTLPLFPHQDIPDGGSNLDDTSPASKRQSQKHNNSNSGSYPACSTFGFRNIPPGTTQHDDHFSRTDTLLFPVKITDFGVINSLRKKYVQRSSVLVSFHIRLVDWCAVTILYILLSGFSCTPVIPPISLDKSPFRYFSQTLNYQRTDKPSFLVISIRFRIAKRVPMTQSHYCCRHLHNFYAIRPGRNI